MKGKRPETKCIIAFVNFVMLAILFLPSNQSYYLSRNPYNSDAVQIEPPLAAPYIERRSDISDLEKNTPGYWRQDNGIPEVPQSSLQDVGYDILTDYTSDYGNLLEDMTAKGATMDKYIVPREPLVDLPTGIPESVSNENV
jgi:hypothetical protein